MLNILESYDLQGFINGDTISPPQFITVDETEPQQNPAFLKWRRSDRLVKGWLTATLSEEVLGIVIGLSTAGKVWNALVHAFARVSPDRSLALKRRLTTITRGTDTLSVFLRKFKTICDELAAIGKPVPDHKKSWWLLNGLGKEYEVFTATMLRPPIPPYAEIVTHLESYADRYKLDTPATSPMVFYGQKQNKNKKNQGQQVSFSSKGRGFIQGNQSEFKPYNSQSRGQSSNQNANNKNKDEVVVCQICNKRNHTAIKCFNRFNHSFTADNLPQSFAAMKLSDIQDSAWHPDTGATDHMTGNAGNLHSLTPYTGNDGVMVGNGNILPITHIGKATVGSGDSSIPLNDVLLVPDIKKDLLSISKLTSDYPLKFEFDGPGFVIKDRITQRIVARGRKQKGLYIFDGGLPNRILDKDPTALFSNRFRQVNKQCWHQRLGHPHQKIIDYLHSQKFITSSPSQLLDVCTSCQMGKSCRLPFLQSDNNISIPFYKVHCDLWGPAPIVSRDKFRFYAIFVDEFTNFTWLFPLRHKSDLFDTFVQFHNYVSCQFDAKIRIFQSDEGGEFAAKAFTDFLTAKGIHHQSACPKTPEQNGKAERKHRSITELGLTMMFHAKIPPRF